jgi:hypothetical protein
MWSEMRIAGLLVLAALLCGGCAARQTPSGESAKGVGAADGRPCIANFSVEGGYWTGYAAKSFGEFPDSAKDETFAYLLSKIPAVGYLIDSSDKAAGLIRASYPLTFGKGETTALNASVSQGRSGVRVDLTFLTGGMATFSIDEVRKEFCSILAGVPKKEVAKPVETQVGQGPTVAEKPPVVETPTAAALQTAPPPSLRHLVVDKRANLRAKASTKSRIIGVLKIGEKLELLDRSGDWFRVKSASGLTGWIFKHLIRTAD